MSSAVRSTTLRARSADGLPRASRGRSGRGRGPVGGAQLRRRRLGLLTAALVTAGLVYAAAAPFFDKAVTEITLPLRHDDIIRQQAVEKDLDPALIAGVIYTESRFVDQTSPAGAKGLMQILPSTADYIARKSGGTAFVQGDLATPQINIAYGSFYLRYLLDAYDGDTRLAIAAYNGGEGSVNRWVGEAQARGEETIETADIPYPETREYVKRVLAARAGYRREYPRELGLR